MRMPNKPVSDKSDVTIFSLVTHFFPLLCLCFLLDFEWLFFLCFFFDSLSFSSELESDEDSMSL